MELILHISKFLSQQLVFTYSLLNHRMKLRTAVLQQVSGIGVAASTEGTHFAEITGKMQHGLRAHYSSRVNYKQPCKRNIFVLA